MLFCSILDPPRLTVHASTTGNQRPKLQISFHHFSCYEIKGPPHVNQKDRAITTRTSRAHNSSSPGPLLDCFLWAMRHLEDQNVGCSWDTKEQWKFLKRIGQFKLWKLVSQAFQMICADIYHLLIFITFMLFTLKCLFFWQRFLCISP